MSDRWWSGRLRPLLLAAAGYLAATVILTWPLARDFQTRLGAPEGPGDPYLNLWILGWGLRTVTLDPAAILTLDVFDANIFHPARGTLAYSDHLLPQVLAVWPVYWLTGDVVVSYNALLAGSLWASALAMFLCARAVTGSTSGAWIAGLAWGFWPYRVAHLIHLQLQALYVLPLVLLFIHRVLVTTRRRDAIGLGLLGGLQAVSSAYYGVMALVVAVAAGGPLAWSAGRWRGARLLRRLALAAVVAAAVAAPFVWPYIQVQRREGFTRSLFEASRSSAIPSSYVQVPASNVIYGRSALLTARDAEGRLRPGRQEGVERELFPGVALALLALVGFGATVRRGNWPVAVSLGVLAAVAYLLSLGPDGVRSVYAAAHRFVFGFQAIRAPARFGVLVMLSLALLASAGVAVLGGAGRARRRLVVALTTLAVGLEYLSVPLAYVDRPPRSTDVGRWLAAVPGPGAVLHLPLTHDRRNTPPMVQSLEHGRPLVNGYSGQRPAFYSAVVDVMASMPSAEALWTAKELGVRFVVAEAPLAWDGPPLVERARFATGTIYELVWTPEAEARVVLPAPPAPPAPGPAPFAPGEVAEYAVAWVGGPMDVAAGTATVAVRLPPGPGARGYVLEARAETAPWVARFFEARDRFETEVDGELLPIEHRRQIREGRRAVDRRVVYRAGTAELRRADGSLELSLPLPPGTRDVLSTFYYLRTLNLRVGDTLRLPLNDAGRNYVLRVRVTGAEAIAWRGAAVPVQRVEASAVERVARRTPPRFIVWLSTDEKRLPMAAEVDAGFGRVRLTLAAYRAP